MNLISLSTLYIFHRIFNSTMSCCRGQTWDTVFTVPSLSPAGHRSICGVWFFRFKCLTRLGIVITFHLSPQHSSTMAQNSTTESYLKLLIPSVPPSRPFLVSHNRWFLDRELLGGDQPRRETEKTILLLGLSVVPLLAKKETKIRAFHLKR